MNGNRRSRNEERGQTLIEFAFAVPILAMVLFGIFEFAVVQFDRIQLTNASRDGARAGAIHFETSPVPIPNADRVTQATDAAETSASNLISCPLQTPVVTPPPTNENPAVIIVRLSCTYSPITPVGSLVGLFGGSLNLTVTGPLATRYVEP